VGCRRLLRDDEDAADPGRGTVAAEFEAAEATLKVLVRLFLRRGSGVPREVVAGGVGFGGKANNPSSLEDEVGLPLPAGMLGIITICAPVGFLVSVQLCCYTCGLQEQEDGL